MNKIKRFFLLLLVLFLSLLIGSVLGKISGFSLDPQGMVYRYVSSGTTLHLPLKADLKVWLIDLKMDLVVNALSLLTMILGGILFFRLHL